MSEWGDQFCLNEWVFHSCSNWGNRHQGKYSKFIVSDSEWFWAFCSHIVSLIYSLEKWAIVWFLEKRAFHLFIWRYHRVFSICHEGAWLQWKWFDRRSRNAREGMFWREGQMEWVWVGKVEDSSRSTQCH